MYKYVLNSVVEISMMFAKYFEYYTIILRGAVFLWTCCIIESEYMNMIQLHRNKISICGNLLMGVSLSGS